MRFTRLIARFARRAWRWLLSEQSGSRPQELFAYCVLLVLATLATASGLVAVAFAVVGWLAELVVDTPAALAVVAVVAALRLTRRRRATPTEVATERGDFSTTDLPELVPIDREPARHAGLPAVEWTPPGEEDDPRQKSHRSAEDDADAGREDSPGTDVLGTPPEPSQLAPDPGVRAPEPPLLGAYRRALAQARAEARELDGAS